MTITFLCSKLEKLSSSFSIAILAIETEFLEILLLFLIIEEHLKAKCITLLKNLLAN